MTTKLKTKKSIDLEAKVYSSDGKAKGTVKLSPEVFGLHWNADLVHQVVTAMQANARQPVAHTKDRSEVRGGGIKPWRQKGTGRARHGSTRSPIWRHGGVTFGPRKDRDFTQKVNRKMRVKALYTVLSKKYADGNILFLSGMQFAEPKTKAARGMLFKLGEITGYESVATRKKNGVYLVLPKADANVKKSFQNMGNVLVGTVGAINPVDLIAYKNILLVEPEECLKTIEARNK
ncbi:MAG: 50S ribosomal protein L4 [Candidatus Lloydbacteria bacterium RIFCSPLOWO2_01_FULL_50_20]|uniref:Large ribosomal subunit protein uL4 n=1 Tax=Candidatus Lloydbacteria bacterium RIFCSPLOWO2_01_FULL_50_20 TaxID=1798665 RepID=A0A1G2DHM7_9BACT|nr:MAG: 50S ribosomal protein L4 [Candidatus Lloydbacteria bacterium RIFCSPHIGHO2_02_FULL_50_11]OGZ13099.1 MAG: 50S ribosomal protein L4 [Candidatus Lloydbacteria bacterium RIFCSPLOWO2_01_FULL_50_20]